MRVATAARNTFLIVLAARPEANRRPRMDCSAPSSGTSSQAITYRGMPHAPTKVRATNPIRKTTGSMPK
jgi:hypothetical protein